MKLLYKHWKKVIWLSCFVFLIVALVKFKDQPMVISSKVDKISYQHEVLLAKSAYIRLGSLAQLSPDIKSSMSIKGEKQFFGQSNKLYAYAYFKNKYVMMINKAYIYLINSKGEKIYQWYINFRKLSSISKISPRTMIRTFKIYPNGNVLLITTRTGTTPWGGPMVLIDKSSNIIWRYDVNLHHDMSFDAKGNIYTLSHQYLEVESRKRVASLFSEKKSKYDKVLDDGVLILDAKGSRIDSFSIYDAMYYSDIDFKKVINILRAKGKTYQMYWDRLHTNSIDYIKDKNQSKLPLNDSADIMINVRGLNIIVFINLTSKKIVGYIDGPWYQAHDARLLDNGNISLFDNLSQWPQSRVIEYNPLTKKIVWQFYRDKENKQTLGLSSPRLSIANVTKNGNRLISSASQYRILEVTKEGEIKWEFYASNKGGTNEGIVGATAYDADELPFLKLKDKNNDKAIKKSIN